jgi:Zn-dependent membrane protease YugP
MRVIEMPFLFFDPMYFVFTVPALLLALFAQWRVRQAYSTWGQVPNQARISGLDAARRLLAINGLQHVSVEGIQGQLTDHYDPRDKTLRLSEGVAYGNSVASLAIVAHEVGHAVQDAEGYVPMRVRAGIVPLVQIGQTLGPLLFMIGLLLSIYARGAADFGFTIAEIGLIFFSSAAVFALATLPVEFNASARAKQMVAEGAFFGDEQQLRGTRAVLDAAALTYVAGLAQALAQMLYWVFLLSGARRRR